MTHPQSPSDQGHQVGDHPLHRWRRAVAFNSIERRCAMKSPSSSAAICQLPVMTSADAESVGFAIFNHVPTLPIDIPDGGFTVSTKTSEGLRVTLYFGLYRAGGPPRFIDIQYHDAGMAVPEVPSGSWLELKVT